jgi:coenzyme F420-reducing hydrogenase delta subunit
MKTRKSFMPFIVAVCCRRSAARARDLAKCMGHELPQGLKVVEVPCSGAVSYDYIFAALDNNADGVMVLTCHKGNCHSEHGNIYAGRTVEQIREMFSRIGFEKERLLIQTLASNMGAEFSQIVNGFEKIIVELGPSRLRKNQ